MMSIIISIWIQYDPLQKKRKLAYQRRTGRLGCTPLIRTKETIILTVPSLSELPTFEDWSQADRRSPSDKITSAHTTIERSGISKEVMLKKFLS